MMGRWRVIAVLTLGAVTGRAQEPAFRSSASVVTVDVSVRQGTRVITGLGPEDFEVTDNGIVQTVSEVTFGTAPIDLTMVVDLSASVDGGLFQSLSDAVRAVEARLQPADRVSLVQFNHHISDVASGTGPRAGIAARLSRPRGLTSVFDALVAASIRPIDPATRQMLMLFTDGRDTLSLLDEKTVQAVVTRAGPAVFVIGLSSGSAPIAHHALFDDIARTTGGQLAVVGRAGNLGGEFVRAFDEFRSSYLVRYAMQGTADPGWHDISVRVTRPGRYDVRARRGYVAPTLGS